MMSEIDIPEIPRNKVIICAATCCSVVCGILAILSIGAVPPLFFGIRYNSWAKWADVDTVYDPGRYFIGPWSSMLHFPSDVQRVEFVGNGLLDVDGDRFPRLHTRTKEGLALYLQVSLQYRLQKATIGKLYNEFSTNYDDLFVSTIRDTLILVASDYTAYELWEQRKEVGEHMQEALNSKLSETFAECWGVQLLTIDLPTTFDEAIVKTQVQKQTCSTMEYAQKVAQIHAQTDVIQSEYNKEVTVLDASGAANYTLITKTATADARKATLDVETTVVDLVKSRLFHNEVNTGFIVDYQQCAALKMMQNSTVIYGFDEDTTQVLIQSDPAATSSSDDSRRRSLRRLSGEPAGDDTLGRVAARSRPRSLADEL